MHTVIVAKVLRPDQVDDEKALRELKKEADALERFAHPVLLRGIRGRRQRPPAPPGPRAPRGSHPAAVAEEVRPSASRTVTPTGPSRQCRPPLSVPRRSSPSRREAEQHRYGSAPEVDRHEHLEDLGVGKEEFRWHGNPSLHGPRAVRSQSVGTDRFAGRRVGDRSDHVRGVDRHVVRSRSRASKEELSEDSEELPSDSPLRKYPQLTQEPPPFSKDVPPALGDMIMRTLSKNQDERPTAAEFASFLEEPVARVPRPRLRRGRPKLR